MKKETRELSLEIHRCAVAALQSLNGGNLEEAEYWLDIIAGKTDVEEIAAYNSWWKEQRNRWTARDTASRKREEIAAVLEPGDTAEDVITKLQLNGKSADLKTVRKYTRQLVQPSFAARLSLDGDPTEPEAVEGYLARLTCEWGDSDFLKIRVLLDGEPTEPEAVEAYLARLSCEPSDAHHLDLFRQYVRHLYRLA